MQFREIARLNEEVAVHSIMLKLPLPRHSSAGAIEQAVFPREKHRWGVTSPNICSR